MTWTVTYRRPGLAGTLEDITEDLDPAWCTGMGINPGAVDSAAQAAWHLALWLGANGYDDAELLTVEAGEHDEEAARG